MKIKLELLLKTRGEKPTSTISGNFTGNFRSSASLLGYSKGSIDRIRDIQVNNPSHQLRKRLELLNI